ncbi:hypothetical protein F4776DRAFT_186804 [Hypoxylon sp. NC0597]|nr:hypothetical protein F4776DRAFT_186804 [Hypoxylon sp. NC0597]
MSSITTAIPTGPIETWCVGTLTYFDGTKYQCANETQGTKESDFETFCCNGEIINSVHDIWKPAFWKGEDHSVNLADMICCGISGPQAGGVLPLPSANTECNQGSPTPLASLAATNTDNAVPFRVTYTSASFGDNTVGDFIPTNTPNCFWALTKDVATTEITLPTPDITTLPPATTDQFGFPITTASETRPTSSSGAGSTGSGSSTAQTTVLSGTASQSGTESSGTATPTPSGAGSAHAGVRKGYLYAGLGLVVASLLWS